MRQIAVAVILLALIAALFPAPAAPPVEADVASTFSIVAYDPDRKEWGIAVASKYLAVGSAVPFAKAGVGAVATQSYVNVDLGPKGLELMATGTAAEEALEKILADDKGKATRQVGIVDAKGEPATFTGDKCNPWAGGKKGKHFACQGNILTGPEVVDKMAEAFEAAEGRLAWRLMDALEAGEKAGGDKRGKQSAAILVVRERGGPNGFGDRVVDLRVDDHKEPVAELARILALRLSRTKK
jgi:uncharacterized Ntn-hydrolase superfamily protein